MKLQKIEGSIVSFAKAMPLVMGAASGLIQPAKQLLANDAEGAGNTLIANYTFYNPATGGFDASRGTGVKGLAVGAITSKLVSWITE